MTSFVKKMLPLFVAALFFGHLQTTVASPSGIFSRQSVVADLPNNWSFFGCFVDSIDSRSLSAATFTNTTSMTVESCVNFCNAQGFTFAGVEFGQECYCDNVFEGLAETVDSSECNEACVGNANQDCGAASRLSVYTSGVPATLPSLVPSVGAWTSLGCFNDSVPERILPDRIDVSGLTVETCTATCFIHGFTLAGLEFGQECWCGSQIANGGTFVGNDDGISGNPPVRTTVGGPFCDKPCVGNEAELCGGSNRMNLYQFTGSITPTVPSLPNQLLLGCFQDPSSHNLLSLGPTLNPLSVEGCTSACQSQGSTLSGLGEGSTCYCDTSTNPGVSLVTLAPSACNTVCNGSPFEFCGGPNAVNIFQFQNVQPVTDALNAVTSSGNALLALINSVTAGNVATVGPQIVPAMQTYINAIGSASNTASGSVEFHGHFNPLIDQFAQNTFNLLDHVVPGIIGPVFSALNTKSGILVTGGFSGNIATAINNMMNNGVSVVRNFGFNVIPSFQQSCLSLQSEIENDFNSVQSQFPH